MFDAGDFLAVFAFVCPRNLMSDKLLACCGMPAFGEPGKMLFMNSTIEIPLARQPALPFAEDILIAAPVALLTGSEFLLVVGSCLAGG